MNLKITILIVIALSVGFVGNAYAHKSQIIDEYKIEAGWKYEPPTAGKRNYIELIFTIASAEDKASSISDDKKGHMDHSTDSHDKGNATKSEHAKHDHPEGNGISGLAKKLDVDVTLNGKKKTLKLFENKKNPGHYLATFTPSDEGFPIVHIFGKINHSDIEATFHPEKVEAKSE